MADEDLPTQALDGNAPSSWANQVRDNFRWSLHDPSNGAAPAARIWRSTDQNAMAAGDTVVFDTAVVPIDRGGMVVLSPGVSKLIVPNGGRGLYRVGCNVRLDCTYDGSGVGTVAVGIIWDDGTDAKVIASESRINEFSGLRDHRFNLSAEWPLDVETGELRVQVTYLNQTTVNCIADSSGFSQAYPALWASWYGRN